MILKKMLFHSFRTFTGFYFSTLSHSLTKKNTLQDSKKFSMALSCGKMISCYRHIPYPSHTLYGICL